MIGFTVLNFLVNLVRQSYISLRACLKYVRREQWKKKFKARVIKMRQDEIRYGIISKAEEAKFQRWKELREKKKREAQELQ